MDVGTNGAAGVSPEDDDDDDDDDNDDDGDDELETQEVRLVPLDVAGGLDAALDGLFEALSACAALNPDEDESESEEDDGGDAEDGVERLDGIDGMEGMMDAQSFLAAATPSQLAMLDRYDAMLDASSVETGVGNLIVDNRDGRYDDADDDDEEGPDADTGSGP